MDWLKRLRAMRKASGMTAEEISKASGVPVNSINRIFAGQTKAPRLDTVRGIVTAMGYTLDDLLPSERPPRKQAEEVDEYIEVLRTRSGVRALVSMAKNATDEEVEQALAIIQALQKKTSRR